MPKGEYRPGHVRVVALVAADAVALREAEDVRDALSVNQVVGVDERRHGNILYVC